MHIGTTRGPDWRGPSCASRPARRRVSADGKVAGCYLHGLFAADGFRQAFLARLNARADSGLAYEAEVERILDKLADHLEASLDLDWILQIASAVARRTG